MEHRYPDRESASVAAAEYIERALERRLAGHDSATLVVSGGTTPARCFAALSASAIPWERVHVTLSDERWVPPTDSESNEGMVRRELLTARASDARFFPLYRDDKTIDGTCAELDSSLRDLPFPFACALLGMGEDGHFASLFPDAENLSRGLDVDGSSLSVPILTAASTVPRVSLTMAALTRSDEILLLIFGESKLRVYEEARQSAVRYPVSRLLWQKRAPIRVIWAP